MNPDLVLRVTIIALAVFVAGSTAVVTARYLAAALRLGRAPGRILARHVVEVAAGSTGLAAGYAWGTFEALAHGLDGPPVVRLWLYLVSMVLLAAGVLEVGTYQRRRARRYPQRQEQVRAAVRGALEGHPVSGPRSADRVAVRVANAVLALEGTPPMPEPDPARPREVDPAAVRGRHARRSDQGQPPPS